MRKIEDLELIISTDSGCDLSFDVCLEIGVIPFLMKYSDDEKDLQRGWNYFFFGKVKVNVRSSPAIPQSRTKKQTFL